MLVVSKRRKLEGIVRFFNSKRRFGFVDTVIDGEEHTFYFGFRSGLSYRLYRQERPRWAGNTSPYRDPVQGERIRFRLRRFRDGNIAAAPWGLQEEYEFVEMMVPRLDMAA